MPKVSVITPVYNVEAFLRETLESLEAQTLDDVEVLLIDDGSTDRSPEILEEFCRRNPHFRTIRQENAGVAAARNRGLEEAGGEYVAFLDSDDLYDPGTLEAYYTTAKRQNAELVIGRIVKFNPAGEHYFVNPEILSRQKSIDPFDKLLTWNFLLGHKLYLRTKIEELGLRFQNLGYAEDAVFYTGFLYHCTRVAGCAQGLFHYRKRAFWETPSITQSVDETLLLDFFTAHRLIYEEASKCWQAKIEKALCKGSLRLQRDQFLDELNYKELFVLVDHFYRFFWRLPQKALSLLRERYISLLEGMTPMNRSRMVKRFPDLAVNDLEMSREALAKKPVLSAILTPLEHAWELERTLQAAYAQNYPAFEILAPDACRGLVPDGYAEKENFHYYSGSGWRDALSLAAAPNVIVLDRPVLLHTSAFGTMATIAGREKPGLLWAGTGSLAGGTPVPLRLSSLRNPAAEPFLCNKLWSMELLRNAAEENPCLYAVKQGPVAYHEEPLVFFDLPESLLLPLLPEGIRQQATQMPEPEIAPSGEPTADEVAGMRRRNRLRRTLQWVFSRSHALNRILFFFSGLAGANLYGRYGTSVKDRPRVHRFDYYIRRLFLAVARGLMRLLPVKNQVFFYSIRSNGSLLDNARLVYDRVEGKKLFFAHKLPHSQKMKLSVYFHMLTSKVIVMDDYNRYLRTLRLRKNQRVVQLWHACGAFKKFGLDAPSRLTPEQERATHAQYSAVLVSAPGVAWAYESAFGLPGGIVKPLGVPRTDLLFDREQLMELRRKTWEDYPVLENKRMILYCPTFREVNGRRVPYRPKLDWKKLNDSLKKDEVFVIRRHPLMEEPMLEPKETYSRVVDLTHLPTIGLLSLCAVLVTDYSSVIYEGALLQRPIVLFCPDYGRYERDFYLRFEEDLPFPLCKHGDELIAAVRGALEHPDTEGIRSFCEKNLSACDGHSTERAAELVQAYLDK